MYLLRSLLLSSLYNNLISAQDTQWINRTLQQLEKTLNPHLIYVFTNASLPEPSKARKNNFYELTRHIPSIKLDLSTVSPSARILQLFEISARDVLQVHVHQGCLSDVYEEFFQSHENLASHYQRLKLLTLEFADRDCSNASYGSMFQLAWSLKILDFSVLRFRGGERPVLLHFDPFRNLTSAEAFGGDSPLFPEKLRDANGYALRLPYFHSPPILDVSEGVNGSVTVNNGLYFSTLKEATDWMNFSLEYMKVRAADGTVASFMSGCVDRFDRGDIDLMIIPVMRRFAGEGSLLYLYLLNNCLEVLSVGPVATAISVQLPTVIIFLFILLVPSAFLVLNLVARRLQLCAERISALNLARVFFGSTPVPSPGTTLNKAIYTFVAVVSMVYSSDFISKCMDLQVTRDAVRFDSFKAIDDSNLTVVSSVKFDGSLVNESDAHTASVLAKMTLDDTGCVGYLIGRRPVICLGSYLRAAYNLKIVGNASRGYKVSRPLACAKLIYAFERASPFFQRFGVIFDRLNEAGISTWLYKRNYGAYADRKTEENEFGRISLSNLWRLLSAGYFVAFVCFLGEIFIEKVRQLMRKNTSRVYAFSE